MKKDNINSQIENWNEKNIVDEALLTIEYSTGKVFWRLFFPNGLGFVIFGSVFIDFFNKMILHGFTLKDGYIFLTLSFIVIASLLLTIEMLLVKEIRFYQDRLEKEWAIFGTSRLEYSNARIRGISSWFVSMKNFLYIKKPKWYKYKCCGYDEHLLSNEDKKKALVFLAKISGRDLEEFNKTRLEINPLIKHKGQK